MFDGRGRTEDDVEAGSTLTSGVRPTPGAAAYSSPLSRSRQGCFLLTE